jgi:hypothetical protein
MIIGEIQKDEKTVRLKIGIKASEKYSNTDDFKKELKKFKENYLCGICRDKKRVNKF